MPELPWAMYTNMVTHRKLRGIEAILDVVHFEALNLLQAVS
jgi:hypothetical protein